MRVLRDEEGQSLVKRKEYEMVQVVDLQREKFGAEGGS